jgi:hypothetical protein
VPDRDYPKGHPMAVDYDGEPYTPPDAPFSKDYQEDHPARGGANIDPLSSPDGMRDFVLLQHEMNVLVTQDMQQRNTPAQGAGEEGK